MESLQKRDTPSGTPHEDEDYRQKEEGDFSLFAISPQTGAHLKTIGINYLFPIQTRTFHQIYQGKDLIGKDRTGSGKTLAFSLPILERLRAQHKLNNTPGQEPLVIVLVPTRELAMQVTGEFKRFMNFDREFRVVSIYGKTEMHPQIDSLKAGVEVLVGTPGRILDLLGRNALSFRALEHFILDETDQMLNIGFQEDIEHILKLVGSHLKLSGKSMDSVQYLLFSATVPKWVRNTSDKFMSPDFVYVDMVKHSETKTSKTVEHLCLYFHSKDSKIDALADLVAVHGGANSRTIIFTDTKDEANQVMRSGQLRGECQVLHGDIPQRQREITFTAFRNGSLKCLVATNVASRGLDIPTVDLIVQLSPPKELEAYIHRSGRTGRAGKMGKCITFFTNVQQHLMERIEDHANIRFKRISAPQPSDLATSNARDFPKPKPTNSWKQSDEVTANTGDVDCSFANVSADVLVHFRENANKLLSQYPADEAMTRALAIISGNTNKPSQGNQSSFSWANNNGNCNRGVDNNAPKHFDRNGHNGNGNSNHVGWAGNGESGLTNNSKDKLKLFVGGLPLETREVDLEDLCFDKGLKPVEIYLGRNTDGTGRGFAKLKFSDEGSAAGAMSQLKSCRLGSRSLRVDYADKRQ